MSYYVRKGFLLCGRGLFTGIMHIYLYVLEKKISVERVNQERRLVEFAEYISMAGNQQ